MDLFTRDDLAALLGERPGPCLSLFMPAHRGGSEQDPIRFRNLLTRAEDRLVEAGRRSPEARDLLAPARALLEQPLFWKGQCDGLALFLAPDFLCAYRLPLPLAERVALAEQFRVSPLLPLLSGDGRFFVLALSQKGVRLLQATRDTAAEVDVKGMPAGLEGALRTHDRDEPLNFHTRPANGAGSWTAIFHGQGVGIDDHKDDLLRYFRQVDRALQPVLARDRAPLVLACVGYLMPIYRQANSCPHLLERGVEGGPDRLGSRELHDRAWPLVRPLFDRARADALALYHRLAGKGRTAGSVPEIVAAACAGQVEVLLVSDTAGQRGSFAATADVDLAVAEALRHGGTAYELPSAEMPPGAALAAILRLPRTTPGNEVELEASAEKVERS
jgi:hypothetical protein